MGKRTLLALIALLVLIIGLLLGLLFAGGDDDDPTASDDSADTTSAPTTTGGDDPTASDDSADTTSAPTTTAAADDSASTTEAPTTTAPPTTTTLPPGSGVIVAGTGVAGWSEAGEWRSLTDGPLPAEVGETYQVIRVGEPVTTAAGGAITEGCEFADPSADVDGLISGVDWPDYPIAVAANWDVVPHTVEMLSTDNATYKAAASDLLAVRGVIDPDPPLVQVIRVDLEGDGVDEIIVAAERNASGSLNPATPGDYSIVFMRKLIEGDVQTAILGSFVVEAPPDETWIVALDSFRVAAVADLNGDGRMEIAVNGRYYEGAWTTIYDYINDDLGPWEVLYVGCGV